MAVWSILELWTEMLENLEPVLDSPRTVWVACVIFVCFS